MALWNVQIALLIFCRHFTAKFLLNQLFLRISQNLLHSSFFMFLRLTVDVCWVDFFICASLYILDHGNKFVLLNFDVVQCTVEHWHASNSMFVWLNQVWPSSDVWIVYEADVSDTCQSGTGHQTTFHIHLHQNSGACQSCKLH